MAIYYNNMTNINRRKADTVLSSLAYSVGAKGKDLTLKETYRHSPEDTVKYVKTIVPKTAPRWYKETHYLWKTVEDRETKEGALIAKKNVVALPREMDLETQEEVLRQYVRETFVSRGYCATLAIHDRGDGNPFGCILITTRAVDENGEWCQKEKSVYSVDPEGNRIPVIDPKTGEQKIGKNGRRLWKRERTQKNWINTKEALLEIRKSWADVCNRFLEPDNQITEKSRKTLAHEAMAEEMNRQSEIGKQRTEAEIARVKKENYSKVLSCLREWKDKYDVEYSYGHQLPHIEGFSDRRTRFIMYAIQKNYAFYPHQKISDDRMVNLVMAAYEMEHSSDGDDDFVSMVLDIFDPKIYTRERKGPGKGIII